MTLPATPTSCVHCPWRISNHGKRHPDGWYTRANLARRGAGVRRGAVMSCHPTDPNNPVSAKAQAAGYHPAPPASRTRECTGGLILQQREVATLQEDHESIRAYRAARPYAMTAEGLAAVVARTMFVLPGETPMTRPDLNQDDVGHPDPRLAWSRR